MTARSISWKILKIIGIALVFLVGILVSLHLWFVSHAEDLLSELVREQSKGKLKLEVEKFRFNWLNRKMELRKAVFYTTNDSTATNGYRIEVDQLQLRLKALYPLIAEKKFLIDSLKLINPKITVTNLRTADGSTGEIQEHLSIAQEMGKVYNSIRDALKVLEVDRFRITNGQFVMINKVNPSPDEKPVAISRIDFHLDNLRVDSAAGTSQQKILFSDNVALQTTRQDIYFPDGRHRLSFSNFRINLQHRLAEFDSCTISARKGDTDSSSFTVFFDKLRMTNIDFDTLYKTEVIKADSVYCVNPQFRLNVNLKDKAIATAPKLDELLLQLTGDLHLNFAVVENGSFDINIKRNGHPSSFVSDHNNFEVQGLRVQKSAPKPVTVQRFAMAIRNYENFLRDSSFSIRFDSILLYSNRISLANFVFKEYKSGHANNQVGMPQFELYGLSWDELVFSRRLKAGQLVLYKPVINYTLKPKNGKPVNIFGAFREINKLLELHNLSIIDGEANLDFGKNASLKLKNVTSFISAQQLVRSHDLKSVRGSVERLMFTDGLFQVDDLSVNVTDAVLSNTGDQLQAATLSITQKNKLDINAGSIRVNSLLLDEENKEFLINNVNWANASVRILSPQKSITTKPAFSLLVNNIKGRKTKIDIHSAASTTSLFLDVIDIKKFTNDQSGLTTQDLSASGSNFIHKKEKTLLSIEKFALNDGSPSHLINVIYQKHTTEDSALIRLPSIDAVADISTMLKGHFNISSMEIAKPSAYIQTSLKEDDDDEKEPSPWPMVRIEKLRLKQPDLYITTKTSKGRSLFQWKGGEDNYLELEKFAVDSNEIQALNTGRLSFVLNGLIFRNAKGKTFRTKQGNVSATLENLRLHKNDADAWDWKGKLSNLSATNFIFDSLDKAGGRLEIKTAKLNDLMISSSLLLNTYELVKRNTTFTLKEATGTYQNNNNKFDWHNIRFDKNTRELAVDSFSYLPVLTQEEFMRTHPYQMDYAKVKTGRVSISRVDLDRFLKDTVLDLGTISVNDGWLDDFRDKRLPRQPGVIRPLPVEHLKRFPVKVSVDTLQLLNTEVKYGEFNEKTQAAGWIRVNRLNGYITNIRNHGAGPRDSLAMEATAWLEDSLYTALQVKGSYTDPLQGFIMKVQMGPADLRVLNGAIGPLAGASLKSGFVDTMTMQVKGNDQVAYGEMLMVYHDLKVTLAGKPNREKRSFLTRALNSIVNTVIKNKNTDRKGVVFFVRLQDRSALNYLVKTTLSGVGSSAGLGKNKRQLRRYLRRGLREGRQTADRGPQTMHD
ncbi:MAG: hypothetical protein DI535_16030 [Citrobacter freundii]|nr:MAG: hypothetical protein DI535_16030 [Citrobacter freundii]